MKRTLCEPPRQVNNTVSENKACALKTDAWCDNIRRSKLRSEQVSCEQFRY